MAPPQTKKSKAKTQPLDTGNATFSSLALGFPCLFMFSLANLEFAALCFGV